MSLDRQLFLIALGGDRQAIETVLEQIYQYDEEDVYYIVFQSTAEVTQGNKHASLMVAHLHFNPRAQLYVKPKLAIDSFLDVGLELDLKSMVKLASLASFYDASQMQDTAYIYRKLMQKYSGEEIKKDIQIIFDSLTSNLDLKNARHKHALYNISMAQSDNSMYTQLSPDELLCFIATDPALQDGDRFSVVRELVRREPECGDKLQNDKAIELMSRWCWVQGIACEENKDFESAIDYYKNIHEKSEFFAKANFNASHIYQAGLDSPESVEKKRLYREAAFRYALRANHKGEYQHYVNLLFWGLINGKGPAPIDDIKENETTLINLVNILSNQSEEIEKLKQQVKELSQQSVQSLSATGFYSQKRGFSEDQAASEPARKKLRNSM